MTQSVTHGQLQKTPRNWDIITHLSSHHPCCGSFFSKVELVSEVELVSGVWWCDLSVECPADTSPHTPHTAQPPHRPTLTAFLTPQSTVLCSISQVVWRMCCVLTARSVQCTAGSPECKVCTKLFAVHCASCAVCT